jgi:hypothetical protein
MFFALWQKCFNRPPWTFRRRPPPPRRCRPRLEALEGRCVPSTVTNLLDSGTGSLRQAIAATPAGGTVDFQPGLSGTITLTSGELAIAKNLTITGPGANTLTVSGNHPSRVFEIATSFTVNISGLTIADGSVTGTTNGGGIFNAGTLTITASTDRNNSGFNGGGILNGGTLTVTDSTLSGNSANGGGGIFNLSGGRATVTNSTLSGNSARGPGGGIYNPNFGTLTVTSSNFADVAGGVFGDNPLSITNFRNTIIAGNTASSAPDLNGSLHSQGHNLIGNGTGGSGFVATDLVGTAAHPIDPKLGPLQNNGGPTQTLALLPGSPAARPSTPATTPSPPGRSTSAAPASRASSTAPSTSAPSRPKPSARR